MRLILSALAACCVAAAQPAPKFEVASIKPCKAADPAPGRKGGRGGGAVDWSPARLNAQCQTVATLIRDAWLRFPAGQALPADPQTVFAAAQRFGLKLGPAKAPAGFLEIDRIQRPTEN